MSKHITNIRAHAAFIAVAAILCALLPLPLASGQRVAVIGRLADTVNIGPGVFACWDRLFGTYQPLLPKVPSMGLTGQPPLVMAQPE